MQLNSEDDGNRKYIMVQLSETTDEKSEALKAAGARISCRAAILSSNLKKTALPLKSARPADSAWAVRPATRPA